LSGAIFVNGLSFLQVASACYDRIDAGQAWMKGYHDAQRDFQGINCHGFDDSTHLADKENYQADIEQDGMMVLFAKICDVKKQAI
jgi:hypothetical protein